MGLTGKPSLLDRIRLTALRLKCGVKKIPKSAIEEAKTIEPSIYFNDSERGLSNMNVHGVSVHPIGIKKDKWIEMHDPVEKKEYWQEGL